MGQMIVVHDDKVVTSLTGKLYLVVDGKTWVDVQPGDHIAADSVLLTSAGSSVTFSALHPEQEPLPVTVNMRTAALDHQVLPDAKFYPDANPDSGSHVSSSSAPSAAQITDAAMLSSAELVKIRLSHGEDRADASVFIL